MVAVGTAGVKLCGIAVIEVDLFFFFSAFGVETANAY